MLHLVLVNHIDLGGTVRPSGLSAVLIGEQGAVSVRFRRWQAARHYGRTTTDDKRRRR